REHRARSEGEETRRGEYHRRENPPERKLAGRPDDADEREELDLDEQHEERERERGRAERTPAAVGERDIDEAGHQPAMLEEGRRAFGSNADHSDRRADGRGNPVEVRERLKRKRAALGN